MKTRKGRKDCKHHWLIDSPRKGRRMWGRCKKCPAQRVFHGAWTRRKPFDETS